MIGEGRRGYPNTTADNVAGRIRVRRLGDASPQVEAITLSVRLADHSVAPPANNSAGGEITRGRETAGNGVREVLDPLPVVLNGDGIRSRASRRVVSACCAMRAVPMGDQGPHGLRSPCARSPEQGQPREPVTFVCVHGATRQPVDGHHSPPMRASPHSPNTALGVPVTP
jgi:hypothetical protein